MFVNAAANVCEEQLVLGLGAVKCLATEVRLWSLAFCFKRYFTGWIFNRMLFSLLFKSNGDLLKLNNKFIKLKV